MAAKPGIGNPVSLSIAPVNQAVGKPYSDLMSSIGLMQDIQDRSSIDGFEFQCLEEWDENGPPLDNRNERLDIWRASPKYTIQDIARLLKDSGANILSVHAKRDTGIYLCSGDPDDIGEGKRLIHEALWLACEIGAPVCVFHLWDTWKQDFDLDCIKNIFAEISSDYPDVVASVENVPTGLKGHTPFDLVKQFRWITLDIQWAALYGELHRFEEIKDRIVNIHLRGELMDSGWAMKNHPLGFYETLDMIRNEWNYQGLLTMEPNGLKAGDFDDLMAAMETLVPG